MHNSNLAPSLTMSHLKSEIGPSNFKLITNFKTFLKNHIIQHKEKELTWIFQL